MRRRKMISLRYKNVFNNSKVLLKIYFNLSFWLNKYSKKRIEKIAV